MGQVGQVLLFLKYEFKVEFLLSYLEEGVCSLIPIIQHIDSYWY